MFSHIIGQIDNDNNGISGLEKSFDYELRSSKENLKLTVDKELQYLIREELPKEYVDKHLTPSYYPWEQRLCIIPDNDLFKAINENKAAIVTDTIDEFYENGVILKSGKKIEADIIISATGLVLENFGFSLTFLTLTVILFETDAVPSET